jgi:hypothetical protein
MWKFLQRLKPLVSFPLKIMTMPELNPCPFCGGKVTPPLPADTAAIDAQTRAIADIRAQIEQDIQDIDALIKRLI